MQGIMKFLQTAEKLKSEKRKTLLSDNEWESVASHTWMMGLLAVLFLDKSVHRLDGEKVFKMIVVHDLAEAETGDIAMGKTFQNRALDLEKKEKEQASMNGLLDSMPDENRQEIMDLWQEFEKDETREARFVKALDKLESYFQVSCAEDVSYIERLGDGDIYWKIYCQDLQKHLFADEPELCRFWDAVKPVILEKMRKSGINPVNYMEKEETEGKYNVSLGHMFSG